MSRKALLILVILWFVAGAIGVVAVLRWRTDESPTANAAPPSAAPRDSVPDFALTDQNGRPATLADLRGRIWVGAFIYTRCSGICPGMSRTLASLQAAVADPDVHLVSFSVDPEHDTPAVLKAYADKLGADSRRWLLLTGERAQIERVSRGMLLGVTTATRPDEITHSDQFVLVARDGTIEGYYAALEPSDIARLKADIAKLSAQAPLAGGAAVP